MWELILSYTGPMTPGMPLQAPSTIPSLPGEVTPRPETFGGVAVAFRALTKNGAANKAQNAFISLGWPLQAGTPLTCLAIAANAALRESAPGRLRVPFRGPGYGIPGMQFNIALPPGCSFQWRYVSPTMRQTPARASLPAQPGLMSRFFATMGIGAKKSGACCDGCETGTGCADPSTGCTGSCVFGTGCDCKKMPKQTTVGACLSYLYGTGCPPKSQPVVGAGARTGSCCGGCAVGGACGCGPTQYYSGFQTGGGCGGGGCGGGYGYGYGGYGGGCGYSTPCNIGCGSTAGCGSSGCGPGGCGNCGSGSVGCGPCLLGGWG